MSETVHITDSLCGDVETEADVYAAYIYAFGDSFNEKCGADGVREKVLSRYDALPGSLTGEYPTESRDGSLFTPFVSVYRPRMPKRTLLAVIPDKRR